LEFSQWPTSKLSHSALQSLPLHPFPAPLPKMDGHGRIAAVEILRSTMRTPGSTLKRVKAKAKSLLDAMRDGSTEGMQHFDGRLTSSFAQDRRFRNRNNPINPMLEICVLEMADFLDERAPACCEQAGSTGSKRTTEIEIERITSSRTSILRTSPQQPLTCLGCRNHSLYLRPFPEPCGLIDGQTLGVRRIGVCPPLPARHWFSGWPSYFPQTPLIASNAQCPFRNRCACAS